jgi:hypothetical protein
LASGTIDGSSWLRITSRWSSYHGGRFRCVPSSSALVHVEAAGTLAVHSDQHAARGADVHRVEVEAVLHLGRVGVAELLVHRLLLDERVVGVDVNAMWCAVPAPNVQLPAAGGLVQELDGAVGPPSGISNR